VPRIVRFSGTIKDPNGAPVSGGAHVTFAFYESFEGGSPLWSESYDLQLGNDGRYSVLLGAQAQHGIPESVFSSNQPRWLKVETAGKPAASRIAIVSVPYALKAADADTLAGHPIADFLLAGASPATVASGPQRLHEQSAAGRVIEPMVAVDNGGVNG